jgi:hypothetical protein
MAKKQVKKKIGSGESLPASDFAYVGDPTKTSTFKFPIHDKSHVQNAVARFNQTDLTGAAKASAKRKIRAAYKKFFPENEVPDVIKSLGASVEKATANDIRSILSRAVNGEYDEGGEFAYYIDHDDIYVYFEFWERGEGYRTFREGFSFDGTSAELTGSPVEVVRTSSYEVVESSISEEDELEKSLLGFIKKHFSGSSKNTNPNLPVVKQFEDEEMIAIEPLYILPDTIDGQGDTISLEDTYAMVKSFNEANEAGVLQSSLFHKHKTQAFEVVKAWVNPCECMIGETLIPEGQPLAKIQFINKKAWELRKEGVLMGLSIGARAEEFEEIEVD